MNTLALPTMAGQEEGPSMVDPIFNRLLKDRIIWMGEEVRDDMANDEQYENLSDEGLDAEVAKIIAETAFIKAIVIYVG